MDFLKIFLKKLMQKKPVKKDEPVDKEEADAFEQTVITWSFEDKVFRTRGLDADQTEGEKVIPVLFEEMDGVWLNIQDEHHKKMKKQEMKVFTMYEGWDEEKEKAIFLR